MRRRIGKRTAALLLTLAMLIGLFAGCSGDSGGSSGSGDEVKDLITYATNEMSTFNPLYTSRGHDIQVLANVIDSLLTQDVYGNLIPNAAESWGTDDNGKTWTFHLNEGITWVDYEGNYKADVVAEDWVWAMEWVLNYWKNEGINTSMVLSMIDGAEDYLDYTREMEPEEAQAINDISVFQSMVGVEAVDDLTLVYHCVSEIPYFDTLTTFTVLFPVSHKLIQELGYDGYFGVTYDTQWYCGPYLPTTYVADNEKVLTPNPSYWNDGNVKLFDSVTIKVLESENAAYQLYQTGEMDHALLNESNIQGILNNSSNEYYDRLVPRQTKSNASFFFAWNRNNEDGTPNTDWNQAIANTAFRRSIYYGLDLTNYWSRWNPVDPYAIQTVTFTAANLVSTSDGTDYTTLVTDRTGIPFSNDTNTRYNPELAEQYKQQAIEELTALGVTFPISFDFYIQSSDSTGLENATVLKQAFIDGLGEDYISFNIGTYISSALTEVFEPGLSSGRITNWGADYGDPLAFHGDAAFTPTAHFSVDWGYLDKATDEGLLAEFAEYTRLVQLADAIVDDMDARYNAFADAEAYLLDHALYIPLYHRTDLQLTNINDFSKGQGGYGSTEYRFVGWETNVNGYTAEEYEAFAAAYEAGR